MHCINSAHTSGSQLHASECTLSYTPASIACSRVDLPLNPPPTAAVRKTFADMLFELSLSYFRLWERNASGLQKV